MSPSHLLIPRRRLLAVTLAGTIGLSVAGAAAIAQPNSDTSIRPFTYHASDKELTDLRRRIAATRWPSQELVKDASQGVKLVTMRELARYWQTDYDWRKFEARLNALPQFMTKIDGVDIHFIHVRSKQPNALPVIITHGWPGSVIEEMKIIDPLTNPTAHGAAASDAFDVVIPSMPGYGFSGKPTALGWDPVRIARAWIVLMNRLGYKRYVAQGGDWGNAVTEQMALLAPPELLGIHINMPATIPDDIAQGAPLQDARAGRPLGRGEACVQSGRLLLQEGPGLRSGDGAPSPDPLRDRGFTVGLAAWILDHDAQQSRPHRAAYSPVSPRALPGTTSSTTSRSTG